MPAALFFCFRMVYSVGTGRRYGGKTLRKMSISFEDVSKKKLKAWQKALLAVSGAAALLGVALFMFSAQFGTKGAEYAKKADGAAPLNGTVDLLVSGRLYAFSRYGRALDVFETDGTFCWSVSVPAHQNGEAGFFLKDGWIFIYDRNGTVYRYDRDGTFSGRVYYDYSDSERSFIYLTDSSDELSRTVPAVSGGVSVPYSLLCFDEESVQYCAQDTQERYVIAQYHFAAGETALREYDPGPDGALRALDGEVLIPAAASAKGGDGAAYSVKRGVLRKDGQILYRTPFWDWLRGDPMIGWKIGFIGALVTFVQSILYRKKRRKTGKK